MPGVDAVVQLDQMLRLAALALGVPTALVSFLDHDYVRSRYGFEPLRPAIPLPFEAGQLVVEDTLGDPRFPDGEVRFYAAASFTTPEGHPFGTFCVIDSQPREFAADKRQMLGQIASRVTAVLEMYRMGHELRLEKQRLAEREQELSSLLDSMVEGVVKQDRTGAVILSNAAAEAILGLQGGDMNRGVAPAAQWQAIRTDGSPFPETEHPARLALKGAASRDVVMGFRHATTGDRRWITINARPLTKPGDDRPYAALTTFRDITEQRDTQERLAQHERLVTTGTLAAGVGHEINNPLAFMLANVALAIEELQSIGGGSPSGRLLEVIDLLEQSQKGGERVKRIVRGLKSLARIDSELAPLDVHAPIRNALELTNHELRTSATVSCALDPVPRILADEGRLTQVIVNLVVNAAQAFTTTDPTTNHITVTARRVDDRVRIEVVDNGPGIPADILPRIFDPFFTTKPPGVGTGLGLSISHGIVAAMGGLLDVETAVGKGTTFRVSFPIVCEAVAEVPVTTPATSRALVIDDERVILQSLGRILKRDIGTVELVDDPREALALFERGERFDVVFCDIMMPHMTGIELYESVRDIDPAQLDRFVFVSGDMTRAEIQHFFTRVTNERVDKPFNIQNIRAIARRFATKR
jgi:PAS domain S-box-containing protein